MIRCLLVQISRNQRGQPIRKELLVSGETIQIGRAAGCDILLLDHRIRFHHAVIRHSDEGKLYIYSERDADILVNGSFGSGAEFTPGTHVSVGPYELVAETPAGEYELVLSVEMVHPLLDDHEHIPAKRTPVSLADAGLSKRKSALFLVGIVAMAVLLLPMMPTSSLLLPGWMGSLQMSIIESWRPGDMSRGHHLIGAKCTVCHQKPFEAVPDKACESCHKTVAGHVKDEALLVHAIQEPRCGECHHDHRGEKRQVIQDAQCVTCHAKIKEQNNQTKLADVRDFGTDHPAFNLAFKTGRKEEDVVSIPQNDKARLVEKSGLKFTHELHLGMELGCPSCHQLDEAGERFKPISMEKTCQQSGCHALSFTPPVSGRQVPHGPVRNLMTVLRDHYAAAAISKMAAGANLQCGKGFAVGKNKLESALNCANRNAEANAEILFTSPEGCKECHEITHGADDKDVPWKVAPVTITSHWLRNARFPHASHSTATCTECHDIELSEKSSDVAIPPIEKCRECHVGSEKVKNKISSRCGDCHNFHNGNTHHSATAGLN
ncbi:MAG: FHA domain-containing protein [Gallionellaceae bacterium]